MFEIGDFVNWTEAVAKGLSKTTTGVVVREGPKGYHTVLFPGWTNGHDGGFLSGSKSCWDIDSGELKLVHHYKVGDEVQAVRSQKNGRTVYADHKRAVAEKKTGLVSGVDDNSVIVGWKDGSQSAYFHTGSPLTIDCLRTVFEATRKTWVGRHVRLKVKSGGKPSVDDIGFITEDNTDNVIVNFEKQQGYLSTKSKLELLPPIKEGDKVRCVALSGRRRGLGFKKGKEFVVRRIQGAERAGTADSNSIVLFPRVGHGVYLDEVIPLEVEVEVEATKERIDLKEFKKVELGKHDILGQDKIHEQLELAVELDMPVLIVGDTGSGKTTIVKSIADKQGREYIRFNLTGETTVDEFVGKYVLRNKETVWEDGILLKAMKSGKWLIVDEVNVALPEILFVLHSLLDDDRSVVVANHNGEVVKPHKNFRFFGTMNPVDEYAGTKDLNKAFKSRFGMILNMEYPKADVEAQIIQSKGGVAPETAMQVVDVAQKIRKAKQDGEVFYTCSTRDLIQWASLVERLGINDAFTVSILNKANGDSEKIIKLVQSVLKDYEEAKKAGLELNVDKLIKASKQIEADRKDIQAQKTKIKKEAKQELIKSLVEGSKSKDLEELKKLIEGK